MWFKNRIIYWVIEPILEPFMVCSQSRRPRFLLLDRSFITKWTFLLNTNNKHRRIVVIWTDDGLYKDVVILLRTESLWRTNSSQTAISYKVSRNTLIKCELVDSRPCSSERLVNFIRSRWETIFHDFSF